MIDFSILKKYTKKVPKAGFKLISHASDFADKYNSKP